MWIVGESNITIGDSNVTLSNTNPLVYGLDIEYRQGTNIEFYNGELNDYQEIISTLTNNGSQLQLKFDRLKNIISEKTSVLLNKDKEKSIKTMNEFRSFISENANNDLIQDNKGQGLGDKNLIGMAPGGLGEI